MKTKSLLMTTLILASVSVGMLMLSGCNEGRCTTSPCSMSKEKAPCSVGCEKPCDDGTGTKACGSGCVKPACGG